LLWPFTVQINCSSELKSFANSRCSASSFSWSLEKVFVTVGQNKTKYHCCENIYEQKEHYSFAFLWQVVTIMAKMSNFCHSKRTKSVSQFHLKHPSRILWSISTCRILSFNYFQFKKKCWGMTIHFFCNMCMYIIINCVFLFQESTLYFTHHHYTT
jgi:hypothetical protein